jgi:hypothetical protein
MTAVLAGEGNFQIGHGGPPPCSLLSAQRADDLHQSITEFRAAGLAFRRDWTPLTNPLPKLRDSWRQPADPGGLASQRVMQMFKNVTILPHRTSDLHACCHGFDATLFRRA